MSAGFGDRSARQISLGWLPAARKNAQGLRDFPASGGPSRQPDADTGSLDPDAAAGRTRLWGRRPAGPVANSPPHAGRLGIADRGTTRSPRSRTSATQPEARLDDFSSSRHRGEAGSAPGCHPVGDPHARPRDFAPSHAKQATAKRIDLGGAVVSRSRAARTPTGRAGRASVRVVIADPSRLLSARSLRSSSAARLVGPSGRKAW